MRKIYLLAAMLMPIISFAQMQTGGNLTIFSEDGDRFFLVLNGEKQNDEPQTNIKIEDLPQPYYSAKIIFEDKSLATISKSAIMITDADGKMMDVTYKIKKDKAKKVKLAYYSMIPVPQDFMPPAGMYVRQWGRPYDSDGNRGGGRNQQQNNPNTVGASVNVGGLNMSVSITDPDMDMESGHSTHQSHQSHQTTHTTTTTTTTTSGGGYGQTQGGYGNTRGCTWPMNATDFAAAKKTITQSSFDDTKLTTAKSIVSNNCVSTEQVVQLCNLFSFEDNKLAFAKYAYKYTTDPRNYFKVNDVFSFSSNKEELSEYIQNGQ